MGAEPGSKGFGELTYQAKAAKEIIELYTWWTVTYRNRPDAYEASGWSAYCEASRLANGGKLSWSGDKSPELKKMSNTAHKLLRKIEADYEKEDEQMMIRLIKVRQSLWT
jgi:phage/plasmid-associated DNA primase